MPQLDWQTAFKDIEAQLMNILVLGKEQIKENHFKAGQRASGRTAESLREELLKTSEGFECVLWGRQFFQGLETGRRGGKVPYGFYQIIRQWAIDKGLSFQNDRERNTFSYFVAKKIREQGSLLYRQGGRKDIYSPVLDSMTTQIDKILEDVITKSITTIVKNT